jgi:acetyl-CoA acetyltransferase
MISLIELNEAFVAVTGGYPRIRIKSDIVNVNGGAIAGTPTGMYWS